MRRLSVFFLSILLSSCLKNEIVQHENANTDPAILPNGLTFNFLYGNWLRPWMGEKGLLFLKQIQWNDLGRYRQLLQ